jgi:hypothetical protein
MIFINRSLLFLFLALGALMRAADITATATSLQFGPPPPPPDPDDGGGVVGPGDLTSPIDMYVYILALAAILFMVYFARKNQKKNI